MAARMLLASVWATLLLQVVSALQVTPGSPCSSFCIDAPELDEEDPESSNTEPEDITCRDDDYAKEEAGQKFQRCLTCLQDSEFSHGHESDQQWFFYNLRYTVDYCVLGFPNATDVEVGGPCATSESCGALEKALKNGIIDPAYSEPYDYCDEDDGVLLSDYMDNCLSCVGASSGHAYLSNFLIAIQAGCEQQPANGIIVGLNDTVFTPSTVQIVDPSSISASSSGDTSNLSPPIIAGIVIGSLVVVLLAMGCGYMHFRKRKNRKARARRASPLSFRCQTHITPRTATFPPDAEDLNEKPFVDPAAALSSNPVRMSGAQGTGVSVRTDVISTPQMVHSPGQFAAPPGALTRSPEMDYTTPTSTTSVRSNAPLLATSFRPYVPSDYGVHGNGLPGLAITTNEGLQESQNRVFSGPSPSSAGGQQKLRVDTRSPLWERPGAQQATRDLTKKRASPVGMPVSCHSLQMEFPPPPSSRR